MVKEVKLKCGHSIPVTSLHPIKTERGTWILEGHESACNRTVRVSLSNKAPTIATMEKWNSEGIARTLDGCRTEPDGDCQHGFPSWFKALGMM